MQKETQSDASSDAPRQDELMALTSEVVAAYVGNNAISTTELPELIGTIHEKLSTLGRAPAETAVEQKPAVPIKRSVTNQALLCLDCGKAQKMLKRHLKAAHNLTPEEYRAKWQLPYDYPMVAPDYAEKRRTLAKQIGLGRKRTKAAPKRKANSKKAG